MTSSAASRPRRPARPRTGGRAAAPALRALLVAGAVTAAVPAVAGSAAADEAPTADPATDSVCAQVAAGDLGREGDGQAAVGGSGLTLVREGDRVRVEGTGVTVTGIAVVDEDGHRHDDTATDAGLALEIFLDGYDHVEVCWEPPAAQVVVPDPGGTGATDVTPTATGTPGGTDHLPPTGTDGTPAGTAVAAAATSARPVAAEPAAAPPAAPTAAAGPVVPPAADHPRLAVTGVAVEPLAAWSGAAVVLGAALVLLRSRAARARRNR